MLVRLLRLFPDLPEAAAVRAARVAFIVATSACWRETELARRGDVGEGLATVLLRGTKRKTRFRTVPIVSPAQQSLLAYALEHAKGEGDAIRIRADGEAEGLRIRAIGQAKAQETITKTLTPDYLRYKLYDSPNSKLVLLPDKLNVPILVNPGADQPHQLLPAESHAR